MVSSGANGFLWRSMNDKVMMFTDGACKGNPGPGGWGVVLEYRGHVRELSGGEEDTTNNRMELMAVIKGLQALKRRCDVELFTDSKYVQQGIDEWLSKWKANGWRSSSGKNVKNSDLWLQLDELVQQHTVIIHWVKGHSGHQGNERADALANIGVEQN